MRRAHPAAIVAARNTGFRPQCCCEHFQDGSFKTEHELLGTHLHTVCKHAHTHTTQHLSTYTYIVSIQPIISCQRTAAAALLTPARWGLQVIPACPCQHLLHTSWLQVMQDVKANTPRGSARVSLVRVLRHGRNRCRCPQGHESLASSST